MATFDLGDPQSFGGVRFDGVDPAGLLGFGYGGPPVDINGDGIHDLILNAPNSASGAGAVHVVFGSMDGLPADLNALGSGGFSIFGEAASFTGGVSVAAGDINGDGVDDLIVGARNTGPAGAAHVLFGGSAIGSGGNVDLGSLGDAGFSILGASNGDFAGSGAFPVGDVNGDGIADIIVGAPYNNTAGVGTGAASVVYGSASPFPAMLDLGALGDAGFNIYGATGSDRIGRHFAAGDFDNDGVPDIVIGTGPGSDTVRILPGSDPFIPGDVTLGGASSIDFGNGGFTGGVRVAVGDFDGDGMDDLMVGAPNLAGGGTNRGGLFFLPNSALQADGDLPDVSTHAGVGFADNAYVGRSLASIGDFNGDGFDDLAVGSAADTTFVVRGGPNLADDLANLDDTDVFAGPLFLAPEPGDNAGYSVFGPGDVNGDGLSDLLIGAPDADGNAGAFFVALGAWDAGGIEPPVLLANNTFTGGFQADQIDGGGGNDTLTGGGAGDSLMGDTGDDLLIGSRVGSVAGDTGDSLDGGDGADRGYGQAGDDTLMGGPGNDSLFGNTGEDSMLGDDGDDVLRSHLGSDNLAGGEGNDRLIGGADGDNLDGGAGDDTLDGSTGLDSLLGGADDDLVRGQAGADTLEGNDGNDTLRGMNGPDMLFGGPGSDLLSGGNANDTMDGGPGGDIFEFAVLQGANVINGLDLDEDMLSFIGMGFADLTIIDTPDGALITPTAEGNSPTLSVLTMDVFANEFSGGVFVG